MNDRATGRKDLCEQGIHIRTGRRRKGDDIDAINRRWPQSDDVMFVVTGGSEIDHPVLFGDLG